VQPGQAKSPLKFDHIIFARVLKTKIGGSYFTISHIRPLTKPFNDQNTQDLLFGQIFRVKTSDKLGRT
jgi:hypothetical protein